MKTTAIPDYIRQRVLEGNYFVKLHALQRINERGVLPHEVRDVLLSCTVVEDYPEDNRGHSCLVWGKTKVGKDLHIVCGLAVDALWVITVYEPEKDKWETPLRRKVSK